MVFPLLGTFFRRIRNGWGEDVQEGEIFQVLTHFLLDAIDALPQAGSQHVPLRPREESEKNYETWSETSPAAESDPWSLTNLL